MKEIVINKNTDLDIVSSIWILACNDENSFITYVGIKHRLNLPEDYDVKSLIHLHGELFRLGAPKLGLEKWKAEMKKGKSLPGWIKNISEENLKAKTILELSQEDVFRSQFRYQYASPISEISILNWGLDYIERIRQNFKEKKEENKKFVTNYLIPILSIVISLGTLFSTYFIQKKIITSQYEVKRMELEYKTKQESYSNFMKYVGQAFFKASSKDMKLVYDATDQLEYLYYNLDPLIKNEKNKSILWQKIPEYTSFCTSLTKDSMPNMKEQTDIYLNYRDEFKEILKQELFNLN